MDIMNEIKLHKDVDELRIKIREIKVNLLRDLNLIRDIEKQLGMDSED